MSLRRRIAACAGLVATGVAAVAIWSAPIHHTAGSTGEHLVRPRSTTTVPAPETNSNTRSDIATGSPAAGPVPPDAASPRPAATPPLAIEPETLLAIIRADGAPGSQAPGGPPTVEVPGRWLGAPSILPVIAQQAGWYKVRLAQRPNESVAWGAGGDVSLAIDPYQIVINLAAMHLQLFNDARQVGDFPAGIGVLSDPTPTGHFFVALFAQSPSPATDRL